MSEFALIKQLLSDMPAMRRDVLLGPGDDAALLRPPAGQVLAVTTDTLVCGRHFPEDAPATDVGWKAVMVNLSDLAAMGAQPAWITMTLSLPSADREYVIRFMQGVGDALQRFDVSLVGGDLTQGPYVINVTAMGFLPEGRGLCRHGAQEGDLVCVTGTLGDAAQGLAEWQALAGVAQDYADRDRKQLVERLHRPTARIDAGLALRDHAHAAADISDGFAADLGHILEMSNRGATIEVAALPSSEAFDRLCPERERARLQLSGGDDYELCVCLPEPAFARVSADLDVKLTVVGRIEAEPGLRLVDAEGLSLRLDQSGFDHFA